MGNSLSSIKETVIREASRYQENCCLKDSLVVATVTDTTGS